MMVVAVTFNLKTVPSYFSMITKRKMIRFVYRMSGLVYNLPTVIGKALFLLHSNLKVDK